MSEIPTNNKIKIFGYRPVTPTLKKIFTSKIKEPTVKDRFEFEATNNEVDHLGEIPLEVIFSRESSNYILIKGIQIFHEAKQSKKIRKFQCLILGEVDYDHEATMARLNHVLATARPFHILEQARAIYQTVDLLDGIYGHGGKRRGKKYKKQSAINALCKQFPHKRTRIDDLKRFGGHIGLLGLEGLYKILKAKNKILNILLIHHANPILRRMKMRAKIDHKVKKMGSKGKCKTEISEQIGIMIYSVLYEPQEPLVKKVSLPNSGNDSIGRDPDVHKCDGCKFKQEITRNNGKSKTKIFSAINSRTYKPISEAIDAFIQEVSELKSFGKKKGLKVKETEELHKLGEGLQDSFQKFWIPFGVVKKNK